METHVSRSTVAYVKEKLLRRGLGFSSLLPIQAEVIPHALFVLGSGRSGDILIAAPTGSGKTLAYSLPLVARLSNRASVALRGLVVVPTRELAIQVHSVLANLSGLESDLRVGLASGERAFPAEQGRLMAVSEDGTTHSALDILVATPGRLMDHINHTPGFSLADVVVLVLDEVDALLKERGELWFDPVMDAVYGDPSKAVCKMMASATITTNPKRLAMLRLVRPVYFSGSAATSKKYTLPEGLSEVIAVCPGITSKPLALLHLLGSTQAQSIIIFCSAVEGARRVARLLHHAGAEDFKPAEFSSLLRNDQKADILSKFRSGKIRILVCSDVMARGIDVEGVEAVVNYDAPERIKTYIHRSGRTARAGATGVTFTLVTRSRAPVLREMLEKAEKKSAVVEIDLSLDVIQPWSDRYQAALQALTREIAPVQAKVESTLHTNVKGTLMASWGLQKEGSKK